MSGAEGSSLLMIVDDWEALERYEERLSASFTEAEGWPMAKEGLERARERRWGMILLDLVFEDVTPGEAVAALKRDPQTSGVPLVVVGSRDELEPLALSDRDQRIHRPFEWSDLEQLFRR
jgi:CheY-like chemotaxis protein